MCKITSYMVPEGPPFYATGTAKMVHRCTTHDWMIEGPVWDGYACPIGRVEKAVEDGLSKISAALSPSQTEKPAEPQT